MQPSVAELSAVLRERFGHETFRPGQERVVRDLLAGRDVLAVLPTGGGKSLVYQLTAQFLPGTTLVVTPLLALMKDQEESLEERGVEVGVISSAQSEKESEAELRKVSRERAKLLYVTPERFDDPDFMAEAQRMEVSLLVVDEAHSISEWGHDFRPSYLALGAVAQQLRRPTLLALTATATPWVRSDIIQRLGMRNPDIVVHGIDRPNLFLEVLRVEQEVEDRRLLERLLGGWADDYPPELAEQLNSAMQGSGIVYTSTTRAAQETATWLREWGIPADFYHGQRKKAERESVQEAFMAGDVRVVAATNAFGLGVDKPDVRFVIHRDIPASVEEYWQEAGRAGRDGRLARCSVIYRPADLGRAAFLSATAQLTREEVVRARKGLVARREGTMRELERATSLSRADLAHLLSAMKRDGLVEEKRGRVRLLVPDFDPDQVSLEEETRRRAYERSRVEMARSYAELLYCRREYLLNYFGEEYDATRCHTCDNSVRLGPAGAEAGQEETPASPFRLNERVVHQGWGDGTVLRVTDDSVTVLFDAVGYKVLDLGIVRDQGLLSRAA